MKKTRPSRRGTGNGDVTVPGAETNGWRFAPVVSIVPDRAVVRRAAVDRGLPGAA